MEEAVKNVATRLRSTVVDQNGQRVLKTNQDGSIDAVPPDEVTVEGKEPEGDELKLDIAPEDQEAMEAPHEEAEPPAGPSLVPPGAGKIHLPWRYWAPHPVGF